MYAHLYAVHAQVRMGFHVLLQVVGNVLKHKVHSVTAIGVHVDQDVQQLHDVGMRQLCRYGASEGQHGVGTERRKWRGGDGEASAAGVTNP